jgi:hypothetical protein
MLNFILLGLMLVSRTVIPFEEREETVDIDTVILLEVTNNAIAFAEIYWSILPGKTEITDINGNRLRLSELKELVPCQAEVWIGEKEPMVLKIKILEVVKRGVRKSKRSSFH